MKLRQDWYRHSQRVRSCLLTKAVLSASIVRDCDKSASGVVLLDIFNQSCYKIKVLPRRNSTVHPVLQEVRTGVRIRRP